MKRCLFFSFIFLLMSYVVVSATQPPKTLEKILEESKALEVRALAAHQEPAPIPMTKRVTGLKLPEDLEKRITASWEQHGWRLNLMAAGPLPQSFDCREKGWVRPIRNQGNCGSCWDFAGTECCSGAFLRVGKNLSLSEQYTLDCYPNGGCDGDWPETVLRHAKTHGLPLDSDYGPYQARSGGCKSSGLKFFKVDDYGYVGSSSGVPDPDLIKAAIIDHGPVVVAVAVTGAWDNYRGGKYNGSGGRGINHAVVIVGWTSDGYWIVRNSWGVEWGDKGYIYIKFGGDQIGYGAMWASVEGTTPDPTPDPKPSPGGVPYSGKVYIVRTYDKGKQVDEIVIVGDLKPKSEEIDLALTTHLTDSGIDESVIKCVIKLISDIKKKEKFLTIAADVAALMSAINALKWDGNEPPQEMPKR